MIGLGIKDNLVVAVIPNPSYPHSPSNEDFKENVKPVLRFEER